MQLAVKNCVCHFAAKTASSIKSISRWRGGRNERIVSCGVAWHQRIDYRPSRLKHDLTIIQHFELKIIQHFASAASVSILYSLDRQ